MAWLRRLVAHIASNFLGYIYYVILVGVGALIIHVLAFLVAPDDYPLPIAEYFRAKPADCVRPLPAVGDVMRGYQFQGGDPSNRENWRKARCEPL